MKKRGVGKSKALLTELDYLILDLLLKEGSLSKLEIRNKTKGAYQHIKKRLEHLKSYELIEIKKSSKSRRHNIQIIEEKKEAIKIILNTFKK